MMLDRSNACALVMFLFAGLSAGTWNDAAAAEPQFAVLSAGSVLVDKVYRLNADIDYQLGDETHEALAKGVPLIVEVVIEIQRKREYVWNDSIAVLHQRYQIAYEALSQRYVVTNVNSGVSNYYAELPAALTAMGNIRDLPILDMGLLLADQAYEVRLQAALALDELPAPMRMLGYFSSQWRVASEWFTWPLQ